MRFLYLILLLLKLASSKRGSGSDIREAAPEKKKAVDTNNDGFDDITGAWIPKVSKFDSPETRAFVN